MRQLAFIDYSVIGLYILLALGIGFFYAKKAGNSMEDFFLSGRSMPWWLIGISMAATNFAIDTPLAVAKFVANNGIQGAWYYWSSGFAALFSAFFFSRLWRRAKVITDNELIELRYSGKPGAFLRLFKGVYFGLIINCFVLGWVFNALIKVVTTLGPWDTTTVLVFFSAVTLVYTITSGFYGVVMTDLIQYVFAMGGSITLAILGVMHVGGLGQLVTKLENLYMDRGFTDFTPNLGGDDPIMPVSAFFVLIFVKWWAHKYSDGGGKHIQRMSSAKDETHAVFGTFFYSCFTYIFALWPWIIVGLCGVVVFPGNPDPETNYPRMMLEVLPAGVLGLCAIGLIGAFMSTVDTHLNLGASYFVNDIYKRFMAPDKSEKHYVLISRLTILAIMAVSIILSLNIKSVASAWLFVLSFASGAGLTWILRWFWWRVNAFTEASAMLVSAVVASILKIYYPSVTFTDGLLIIIGITTPIFLIVTYLTPPVADETLKKFYQRVQPSVFGWRPIIDKYNLPFTAYFKRSIANFLVALALLLLLNFGIGTLILKEAYKGIAMIGVSAILTLVLIKRVKEDGEEAENNETLRGAA